MILVRDIRLPLSAGEPQAFEKALHLARIPRSKAAHLGVARLSVDARHGQPKLVYTIAVTLKDEGEESAYAGASPCVAIRGKTDLSVQNGTQRLPHRPVVCGLGPAGLLDTLVPEQVVIEIDADDFYVAAGQQNIACRLYVPSNGKIFALGSYVIQCKIESN